MTAISTADQPVAMMGSSKTACDGAESCHDDEDVMIGCYPQSKLVAEAKKIVEQRTKDWHNTDPHDEERIPRFHLDEIELARVLGKGGFFSVSEVRKITLRHDNESKDEVGSESDGTGERENRINSVAQTRKFMVRQCLRHGKNARYVFKTMLDEHRTDPETFVNSLVDMAIEFKFLATVRHPNILKMRAVSAGSLCHPKAFLILDRIYDTLEVRIDKWKRQEQNPFHNLFDFKKKKENAFLAKRLLVAFDIATALAYLHDIKYVLPESCIVDGYALVLISQFSRPTFPKRRVS
jgi:serine/threonine protein kinase